MIEVGDLVKVDIPQADVEKYDAKRRISRFNGCKARVFEKVPYKDRMYYFKLQGIKSPHGIPYCFVEEWLEKIDEED